MKSRNPSVRIIGVEPVGAANMKASREAGRPVELAAVATRADGLATKKTDPEVFEILEGCVDELITVDDEAMLDAIRFLLERTKLMVEMSGAATTAALLSGVTKLSPGTRTVAVVSGGNYDVAGRMELSP
jgi:threonine dehydratase